MNTVEFPGLGGLKFTINPVALQIGSIPIYWYGIIIAAAFMTAVILALRHCEKYGITQDNFIDLILFAAPAGIIGARLYYVIFSWDSYRDDLTEIFKIWHGGLAIYGGIIAGILTAYFYAKAKNIKPLSLLDFAVPYIPLAQAIGRWGNFVNQEAFGTNTNLPWGMTSENVKYYLFNLQMEGANVNPDIPVHPTFLYESILDIIIFAILMRQRKNKKANGEVVFLYMVLYGIGRFLIEGLRTDSLMVGSLRISQVLAAVFAIVFGILFFKVRNKADLKEEDVQIGTSEYGAVLANLKEYESTLEAEKAEAESSEQSDEPDSDEPDADNGEDTEGSDNTESSDNSENSDNSDSADND